MWLVAAAAVADCSAVGRSGASRGNSLLALGSELSYALALISAASALTAQRSLAGTRDSIHRLQMYKVDCWDMAGNS